MSDSFALLLVYAGLFFFAAGSIGLLRLPDLHSRLHALTKADNLGLGLLVSGLAIYSGSLMTTLKLVLVWALVLAASAAGAYLLGQHALARGEEQ